MVPGKRDSVVGEALAWASRIMAVGVAMFLPAVAGRWLDKRFGTGFFGLVGLVIGVALGIAWLVRMVGTEKRA